MLLLLLACTGPATHSDGGGGGGDDGGTAPTYEIALSGPALLDGLRAEDVTLSLDVLDEEPDRIEVDIYNDLGAVIADLTDNATPGDLVWNLRTNSDKRVEPGRYTIEATAMVEGAPVATASADLAIVTLGMVGGQLGGDDRIALCWHMDGGIGRYWDDGAVEPTFALDDVTDEDGEPAEVPEPWDDVYETPDGDSGWNLPAAYPAASQPELTLSFGGDWTAATDGVTVAIDGWNLVSGSLDDGAITFQKSTPLAEGPRVVEDTLLVTASVQDEVFLTQELPLRIYAVHGPPTFDQVGAPYLPWVAVIDPALRAIDGVEDDEQAVASALVEHIFQDYGLTYDTRYGASVYVSYGGWSYDGATMDLTAFVDLSNGRTVNCSDCAGILGAYANMVGVPLDYSIISSNFSLNRIKAIGQADFTNCPFGPGGCGFSYHAVTTIDESQTIWDATLKLDGDEDPYASPSTEMWVKAITGEEYLDRLVYSGNPRYDHEQKGYIQ